jgi:tetratricopeptide (TPR) repeat protein
MSSSALPQEVFDRVTQAWAVQDYAYGEKLLADARRQYPDHWHLRTCHAAAIGYCSRFRSARAAFDSLIADAPAEKSIHMHGLLGVEWCRMGRHDLALPLLRVAAAAGDPPAPVYEALASALEHLRDASGAREVLEQGLARHGGHPGLLLVLAVIQRQSRDFDLAEATARQVLDSPIASPDAKARAGFELGHALDLQHRFADAFAAFSAAKQARHGQLAPFRPIWEQQLRHLREDPLPTREDFANWSDESLVESPPQRLAMLVGCPRSGTTLLERVLDAHPDLVAAPETTVFMNVWNLVLRTMPGARSQLEAISNLTGDVLRRMREDYFTQMEDALEQPVGNRLLLDKNPSQLIRVPAILRTFPEARILMAIRDPRAVAWSCFTQYLPDNAESAAFNALDTTAIHVASQLRFWQRLRDCLPEESWHETRYERVVDDFDAAARETLGFLDLPWDPQVAEYHANPTPVRSPTYAEAARPVYRDAMEKWRNYEPFLGRSLSALNEIAAELGYAAH